MALPGCQQLKYRSLNSSSDPVAEVSLLPSNPNRAVLTIANNGSSQVLKIGFRGIGQVDVIQYVQVRDHETWVFSLHMLMTTAEIVALPTGFATTLTVGEQVYME